MCVYVYIYIYIYRIIELIIPYFKTKLLQVELIAPNEVADKCPLSSFKFFKTKEVPTGFYEMKTGTINTRTPWW